MPITIKFQKQNHIVKAADSICLTHPNFLRAKWPACLMLLRRLHVDGPSMSAPSQENLHRSRALWRESQQTIERASSSGCGDVGCEREEI